MDKKNSHLNTFLTTTEWEAGLPFKQAESKPYKTAPQTQFTTIEALSEQVIGSPKKTKPEKHISYNRNSVSSYTIGSPSKWSVSNTSPKKKKLSSTSSAVKEMPPKAINIKDSSKKNDKVSKTNFQKMKSNQPQWIKAAAG